MGEHLKECRIIEVPHFTDHRGTLAVIEGVPFLSFDPKRFYYIYDIAGDARRGCHAQRSGQKLILALAGSFKILVDDGESRSEFQLDRPDQGLYVPPMVWHELHSFALGSVCGVLASDTYNADGCYNSYEDFLADFQKSKL